MGIAYLVGTPFSNANSWASSSGGAGGSFGGIPDLTTNIIIDINSTIDAIADISAKISSITLSNPARTITQSTSLDVNAMTISNGNWDSAGFDFSCLGIFTQSNGLLDCITASVFLVGAMVLTGGSMLGSPSLPQTILDTNDVAPTTVADSILQTALNPKRVKGDMGEVEMHSLTDLIKADKYEQSKKASKNVSSLFKQIIPTGSVN